MAVNQYAYYMHKRDGFTVVELTVIIVIVGILLTIGVVGFRSMQASARDRERDTDVATIVNYIESTYSNEYRVGSTVIKPAGAYPQRQIFEGGYSSWFSAVFGDLSKGAMYAPGVSQAGTARSFMSNSNYHTTIVNSSNVTPQSNSLPNGYDRYIYVPLKSAGGSTCVSSADMCRAFQIYYKIEGGSGYKIVESKRK